MRRSLIAMILSPYGEGRIVIDQDKCVLQSEHRSL